MDWLKNMFLVDGQKSMTKIWGTVATVAGAVLVLPTLGLGIVVPPAVIGVAALVTIVSGKLTVDGARDAINKIAKK